MVGLLRRTDCIARTAFSALRANSAGGLHVSHAYTGTIVLLARCGRFFGANPAILIYLQMNSVTTWGPPTTGGTRHCFRLNTATDCVTVLKTAPHGEFKLLPYVANSVSDLLHCKVQELVGPTYRNTSPTINHSTAMRTHVRNGLDQVSEPSCVFVSGALGLLSYCTLPLNASSRFRTVMAYPCRLNTLDGEDSAYAEQVNYFSNPDVDYLGLPTGTSIHDNARVLRENMVRP